MRKNVLLAVLLVMALLLSSCSLIVKDPEVDAATVILKLGDREVTKAQVNAATENVLYQMYQYNALFGSSLDVTDPSVVASARSSAIADLKEDLVLRAKAAELGLDQLTDEETAEMKETAQESWDSAKSYIQSYYLTDEQKALEGDELEQAILAKLDEFGVTMETYEQEAADTIVERKLKEYVIKDVTVPDEDVKADFDSKVAADREKYAEDAAAWTTADRSGTRLYYAPAGVRRVKQILRKFKEDDQTAIDAANADVTDADSRVTSAQAILDDEAASEEDKAKAEEDKAAAQADLDAAQAALKEATDKAFANLDEEVDGILASLAENPDSWDQLLEEMNEDPGMKAGATNAEKGYAVCAEMTDFDSAFVDAAMALASVGDVSGKVRGESYGYYIIKYVGDVAEGETDYDSVKDDIHASLLKTKQDDTYNAAVDEWVAGAKVKEDLGALNN